VRERRLVGWMNDLGKKEEWSSDGRDEAARDQTPQHSPTDILRGQLGLELRLLGG
jgi:hypothetical protein